MSLSVAWKPGAIAVAPSPMSAGVFGIARTTRAEPGSCARSAIGTPAATEMTSASSIELAISPEYATGSAAYREDHDVGARDARCVVVRDANAESSASASERRAAGFGSRCRWASLHRA